jgi:hypothetical protein
MDSARSFSRVSKVALYSSCMVITPFIFFPREENKEISF